MTSEQLTALITDVKNYLDITWTDTDTEKKITGIVERGMKYIDRVAGATLDYTIEDNPRQALFDYCRYSRANALEEFQNNYLPELLTIQQEQEVKAYEATIV